MRKRACRTAVIAGMILSGAYLCASGAMSCGSLGTEAAVASTDLCFVFDCVNGAFNGLIDPCATTLGTDTDFSADATDLGGPFLADCVNVQDGN